MKKRFLIPACVLAAAAAGAVVFAAGHPELSLPWSNRTASILIGLYADAVLLLLVLAFIKRVTCLNALALLFEMGAVFYLVQSILTVCPSGEANGYLQRALGLNCIVLFLHAIRHGKRKWDMRE